MKVKENRGITLIALVITIIVLLILAAVSIATLTGENGILSKTGEAKKQTQRTSAIEQAKIDILAWQAEQMELNNSAVLTDEIVRDILDGEDKKSYVKETREKSFITVEGEHEILYSELYKSTSAGNEQGEVASVTDPKYFSYSILDSENKTVAITGIAKEYGYNHSYTNASGELVEVTLPIYIKDGEKIITDLVLPSTTVIDGTTYTVTSIANGAFYFNETSYTLEDECASEFTSVIIPDTITTIGTSAFRKCKKIETVTIPGSVTTIKSYAFATCNGLKNLVIPDGVETIYDYAFAYCYYLENVTMADSVTGTGMCVFQNCTNLVNIKLSSQIDTITSNMFYACKALESIEIPDGVTTIVDNAFSDCKKLKNVIIPDNVTKINARAFYCCEALETITIPVSTVTIGDSAFYGCSSLKKVNYKGNATQWSAIDIPEYYNQPLLNAEMEYNYTGE